MPDEFLTLQCDGTIAPFMKMSTTWNVVPGVTAKGAGANIKVKKAIKFLGAGVWSSFVTVLESNL